MPSKHKPGNKVLGWRNPPPELAAWLRGEAKRAGAAISALLTEAVTDLRAKRAREKEVNEDLRQQVRRGLRRPALD